MTSFLVGAIEFHDERAGAEDGLAWAIVAAAEGAGLHLLIGPNVVALPVLAALRAHELDGSGSLPFLMTLSPLRSTSQELLSGGGRGLKPLDAWVARVAAITSVSRVHLFTSDGNARSFEELRAKPAGVAAALQGKLGVGAVPALHVRVEHA
jgi:hypothetical protein